MKECRSKRVKKIKTKKKKMKRRKKEKYYILTKEKPLTINETSGKLL